MALLADLDALGISETRSDPSDFSPPPHVHHRHVESYYVLAGEMVFTVGGRDRATGGTWLEVPPGLTHTLAFAGSEEVEARMSCLARPSRFRSSRRTPATARRSPTAPRSRG